MTENKSAQAYCKAANNRYSEYAQFRNGRFVAWIEGGLFASRELALAEARARGLRREGDDFLVGEAADEEGF